MRRDQLYSRAMRDLRAERPGPRLSALRYEGLDTVGHYYLRYTQPRTFRECPTTSAGGLRRRSIGTTATSTAKIGAALDDLGAR